MFVSSSPSQNVAMDASYLQSDMTIVQPFSLLYDHCVLIS